MVIDELVVTLGLDPRKFTEGQRQALAEFKKGKEAAADFGKSVEQSAMKTADAFAVARKGAIGLVGVLAGGEAASFLTHIVNMDAATGRFAKTIGTSVQNLSTWQYMVRQVGGEAAAATSTLSTMQQELENARQGGGMLEGGFASLMNQAGANYLTDNADTVLRKIQSFIAGQVSSGHLRPEQAATFLRRVPGMNEDMINLMLSDFKKIEESVKTTGVATKEAADAAQELTSRFNLMTQAMERLAGRLLPILDYIFNKPTGEIAADVKSGGVKGFLDKVDKFTGPIFEPGSNLDRFTQWEKDKLFGPSGAPSGGSPGGNTRGDRNNNPGNMEYGAFARAHGATGSDGRFAIFPDWQTGSAAQQALISGKGYAGLTLHEFAARYAEGSAAWERTVGAKLGLGPNDVVNNQDPRLADAIRSAEGTGARGSASARTGRAANSSTTTNDVDIHKIEIHAPNATDADGLSSEIGGALKRQSLISPVNNALV